MGLSKTDSISIGPSIQIGSNLNHGPGISFSNDEADLFNFFIVDEFDNNIADEFDNIFVTEFKNPEDC